MEVLERQSSPPESTNRVCYFVNLLCSVCLNLDFFILSTWEDVILFEEVSFYGSMIEKIVFHEKKRKKFSHIFQLVSYSLRPNNTVLVNTCNSFRWHRMLKYVSASLPCVFIYSALLSLNN